MDATIKYDTTYARAYCESIGLIYDEAIEPIAQKRLAEAGLSQLQFDAVIELHADIVRDRLFNPKTYPWYARIYLAFHFLFGKAPRNTAL